MAPERRASRVMNWRDGGQPPVDPRRAGVWLRDRIRMTCSDGMSPQASPAERDER